MLDSVEMLLQLGNLQLAQKRSRVSTKSRELLCLILSLCHIRHHHSANSILWLRCILRLLVLLREHSILLKELKGALRHCGLLRGLCLLLRNSTL